MKTIYDDHLMQYTKNGQIKTSDGITHDTIHEAIMYLLRGHPGDAVE